MLDSSVPRSLRLLYCYCKHALDNGKNLSVILDRGVFEDVYELNLHMDDISPLYHLEPISGNCVVAYIWHLYKKLVKEKKSDKFRFVNPHSIPYVQKSTHYKTGKTERLNQRASVLEDRLSGASVNQLVLVPSNIGSQKRSTLRKKLMRCALRWLNAYKIIFMIRWRHTSNS